MAGSAQIGALRIDLSMSTADLKDGVQQAQNYLDRLATRFGVTAGAAAAAGTIIGNVLFVGLRKIAGEIGETIDRIDNMNDAAKRVGMTAEHFSALAYAVELSGGSVEALEAGSRNLANVMDDMANNKATAATKAFKDWGISVQNADGTLRDSHDVMLDIADRFAAMKDGARETARAVDIFGAKAGPQLVQMLNEGSAGIKALENNGKSLGVVLDNEAAAAVANFKDELDKLYKRLDGLATQILQAVVPALNDMYTEFQRVWMGLTGLGGEVVAFENYLANLFSQGPTQAARLYGQELDALHERLRTIAEESEAAFGKQPDNVQRPPRDGGDGGGGGKPPGGHTREDVSIEEAFFATIGKGAETLGEYLRLQDTEWAQLQRLNETRYLTIAQFERLNQLQGQGPAFAEAYNDAMIGVAATMHDEFGKATEHVISNLKRIEFFFKNTANRSAAQWFAMGDTMVDTMSTVFGDSKEFAYASAIINTAQGITAALAHEDWVSAAAIAAMGAAQIAKIASTSAGGKGGGGGGGSAPTLSGAAPSSHAAPTQTMLIELKGMRPGDVYTDEQIRSLIGQLNEAQRDGVRLKIVA